MIILTAVMAATLVLATPNGLDPEANMIVNNSGLHSVRDTMNQAAGLVKWMALTDQFGIPMEYNSPSYTGLAIDILGSLAKNSKDRETLDR